MATSFRHGVGKPNLPIVIVQIADRPRTNPGRYPSWAIIQTQQVEPSLPCAASVSSGGLARNPDDLHLTTGGQQKLGPKLAAAMARLIERGACEKCHSLGDHARRRHHRHTSASAGRRHARCRLYLWLVTRHDAASPEGIADGLAALGSLSLDSLFTSIK